jgi:ribosomal protein S18 acetylase RimI-like enzyme
MAIPADHPSWLELVRSSMPPFWRLLAESTGGGVWEGNGVFAAIVPGSPHRSFFNSVLYQNPEAMIASIDNLSAAYAGAGVEAWTVWVPEADVAVGEALEAAGHHRDATPRAMAMATGELRPPEPDPALEIREEADPELLSKLNEIAYGYAPGDFPPMRGELPGLRSYFAAAQGETLGCAASYAHGSDCEIVFVAVLPEGRGQGIAGRLTARAVADGGNAGLETTTLQSTRLGHPVYVRLGYRDYGALEMWERRRPD